ncbi:MAG: TonB family protein [Puniceicoccaceae bacterium]
MKYRCSNTIHRLTILVLVLSAGLLQAATTPVQLKEGKAPVYPRDLKMDGIEGMAKVKTHIDESGIVTKAEVVEATHEAFGVAAREAVLQWVFTPGTKDGEPVAQTVNIPLQFALSTQDKLNAQLGREVFVDIEDLTDKVHTWAEVKKWYGFRGRHSKVIPYPEELKGSGISEEITTRLIIGPDGYVYNPRFENLKNKELMMPALEHVAGVRFQSPKLNGEKVYLEQKVKFTCSEDPDFGKK